MRMFKSLLRGTAFSLFLFGSAHAACPTFPYPFTNGSTADANQINSDFGNVTTCFAPRASPSFTGNVGIGTTTPAQALEVNGSITEDGTYIYQYGATGTVNGVGGPFLYGDANNTVIKIGSGGGDLIVQNYSGGVVAAIATSGGSFIVGGNFAIGNTSPNYLLHVGSSTASGIVAELQNSSGACTYNPGASSVTVSCSSDARLKSNIHDAANALPALDDMRVRDFTVKATGEQKTGVVAQEMTVRHPEMVHKSATGFYSVDEPNPWVLVKAIQELHGLVAQQSTEIEQLRADLAAVKSGK